MSTMPRPRVLVDGLASVESPRWHDGRLWFSHWGVGVILAVDLDRRAEVVGHGPPGMGRAQRTAKVLVADTPASGVGRP